MIIILLLLLLLMTPMFWAFICTVVVAALVARQAVKDRREYAEYQRLYGADADAKYDVRIS
jgi:hypothetical protein